MQNSTSGPYVPSVFSPPPYAVAVNALFFASLGVVLIAAFLCMLVKGWIRELDRKLQGIPDLQKRAVIKELREQGLLRWRLPEIITILPSLIHVSLVLFFIGLALYLLQVHKLPAFLTIFIFGFGVLLYVLSVFISAIDDFSPFRSPYSRALGVLYRRLYSRLLLPFVYDHLSLMALPQMIAEKIREQVSKFIKAHEPLSEQAILDAQSPSSKELISQTSVPVLNKLWSSVHTEDTSTYAKNISASILLQLDDLDIRPPLFWHLPWLYETSSPSIKEAKCLVYDTCMQRRLAKSWRFWKTIHAGVEFLEQDPDPWFRLVTLLIRSRVNGDDWDMLKSDMKSDGPVGTWHLLEVRDVALWEAELLQAISDIDRFSEGQWLFVLSAILTLGDDDNHLSANSTYTLIQILVKMLQGRVDSFPLSPMRGEQIDFWLHVMMTLLDGGSLARKSIAYPDGEIQHARDFEAYGGGNIRDPNCIRQLLQSHSWLLEPSLMRGCLVTILCILILRVPSNQQEMVLVDQYLDIIREEMNVITWSIPLTELPIMFLSPRSLDWVVSCLLSGSLMASVRWGPSDILHGFDRELTTAGAQPTTSILMVIDKVYEDVSLVTGAELQNAWLSLYYHNHTRSTFISTIPLTWSPDCTSIASKRLDLYDSETVAPEMDLVIAFLSSHAVSIACRALRWYHRLEENALIRGDVQYFISFPVIFQKGLSTDENCESWLLLVELIIRNWNGTPSEWRSHFVETFFGYKSSQVREPARSTDEEDEKGHPDIGTQAITAQSDGLGWMEDVWTTVLRPMVRNICINPIEPLWADLSTVMHAVYPQSAEPESQSTSPESSTSASVETPPYEAPPEASQGSAPLKSVGERLQDSTGEILGVLALLLEAGAASIPITLCDRLEQSCLLSDERLRHDADSLHRIMVVLKANQEG